jgi:hypothetical protein
MFKKIGKVTRFLDHDNITSSDVDNTIVTWPEDWWMPGANRVEFTYGGKKVYLVPHKFHIVFLKHCFERGDFVELWSKNGAKWALQVAKKVGLVDYVHLIRSKPTRHVDDKENISDIVGDRIFIKE